MPASVPCRRRPAAPRGPSGPGPARRALLAAKFLASDEAEELSDRAGQPVRRPDHRLRLRQDSGRPRRISPAKVQNSCSLAAQGAALVADQNALPHVVGAWIAGRDGCAGCRMRRSGRRRHPLRLHGDVLRIYPAGWFGLDEKLIVAALPVDLAALPSAALALPILEEQAGGSTCPARPSVRPTGALLLTGTDAPGRPARQQRRIDHLALADRLARRIRLSDAARRLRHRRGSGAWCCTR